MSDSMKDASEGAHNQKVFSIEEANQLLPRLIDYFIEIGQLRMELLGIIESKSELAETNGNILTDFRQVQNDVIKLTNTQIRLEQIVNLIKQTGVEIKDINDGIIDFLHERQGKLVYLCWKYGESEILFWHDINSGFSERKPLDK